MYIAILPLILYDRCFADKKQSVCTGSAMRRNNASGLCDLNLFKGNDFFNLIKNYLDLFVLKTSRMGKEKSVRNYILGIVQTAKSVLHAGRLGSTAEFFAYEDSRGCL